MGITDTKQKFALLLHYSGPEVDEIFDTLEDTGKDKDYKKAVEKLNCSLQSLSQHNLRGLQLQKSSAKRRRKFRQFQHTELSQRPVNLQTPIKKSRSKLS